MPHIRSQRRSLALAAGSLLLAAQLSACGFNNATDEIYQSSAGVDYRKGPLDVLSAVVVSDQEGSGTFIATFSNNSAEDATTVEGIAAGTEADAGLDRRDLRLHTDRGPNPGVRQPGRRPEHRGPGRVLRR